MKFPRPFFTLTLLAMLALSGPHLMAGEDIAVADLPKEVASAIETRFPGAKLIKAEKETENGEIQYEVKVQVGEDRHEIDLKPNGEILKVEKKEK